MVTTHPLPDEERIVKPLTPMERKALEYVRNTGGGATRDHFIDDHEPIGEVLWDRLSDAGLAGIDGDDRICLTDAGKKELSP